MEEAKSPLAKMAEQDVFPDNSETFNFLAFPLEIRDIIYDNLYVEDETQLAPFTPMISVFNFPPPKLQHHLLSKLITSEIDAFLNRQKKQIPNRLQQ